MTTCDVLSKTRGRTRDKFNRIVKVIHKAIVFSFLKHFLILNSKGSTTSCHNLPPLDKIRFSKLFLLYSNSYIIYAHLSFEIKTSKYFTFSLSQLVFIFLPFPKIEVEFM